MNNSISIDKKLYIILLIPVIYWIVFFLNVNPLVPDGVQYSDLGRSLFNNGVYESSYGVVPGWVQPPLFPFLIGLFSMILPLDVAGHFIGIVCSVLIALTLFRFVKSTFDEQTAQWSVLLLAINPLFLLGSIGVVTEPLYTLLNLILFIFIYNKIEKGKDFDYKSVFIIGLLFAGLYSTRQEALLYLPLLIYLLIKYSNFKKALVFISMVAVLFSLYGLYSLNKMDEFKIAPKLSYSSRIGLFVAKYYATAENQPDVEYKNMFSWYGYDSTANAIYGENIMDKEYFEKLQSTNQVEIPLKLVFLAVVIRILYNLIQVLKVVVISPFLPVSFLLIVLLGLWSFYKRDKRFMVITALWLFPALYFLISHVEIRFFYVMVPLVSIFAASGLNTILNKVTFPKRILLIIFAVLLLNNMVHYRVFYLNRSHNLKYKAISVELKHQDYKVEKICSKNFYVSFFGDYNYVKLPMCNPDQLFNYMTANKSDLLILDSEVYGSHSGLLDIYNNQSRKFKLINEFQFNNETTKIYHLAKINN